MQARFINGEMRGFLYKEGMGPSREKVLLRSHEIERVSPKSVMLRGGGVNRHEGGCQASFI